MPNKRYLIVDANDIVINVVEFDDSTLASGWQPPPGCSAYESIAPDIGIGWKRRGVAQYDRPVVVPTPAQAAEQALRAKVAAGTASQKDRNDLLDLLLK